VVKTLRWASGVAAVAGVFGGANPGVEDGASGLGLAGFCRAILFAPIFIGLPVSGLLTGPNGPMRKFLLAVG